MILSGIFIELYWSSGLINLTINLDFLISKKNEILSKFKNIFFLLFLFLTL